MSPGVFTPTALAINNITNMAYLTDGAFAEIYLCNISESSVFTGCGDTGARGHVGITIDYVHSNLYSPIPSLDNVTSCKIGESSSLSDCTTTVITQPYATAINNPSTVLYVTNGFSNTNTVTACLVDESGIVGNSCADSGVGAMFRNPNNIVTTY
jgi:hypothetical protein